MDWRICLCPEDGEQLRDLVLPQLYPARPQYDLQDLVGQQLLWQLILYNEQPQFLQEGLGNGTVAGLLHQVNHKLALMGVI